MDSRSTITIITDAQQKCADAPKKIAATNFEVDKERKAFADWFAGLQQAFPDATMSLSKEVTNLDGNTVIDSRAKQLKAKDIILTHLKLIKLKVDIEKLFALLEQHLNKYDDSFKKTVSGATFKICVPGFELVDKTIAALSIQYKIKIPTTVAQVTAQLVSKQPAQQPKSPTSENSISTAASTAPSQPSSSASGYAAVSNHSPGQFKPKSDNSPTSSPGNSATTTPDHSPPPSPPKQSLVGV